MVVPNDLSYGLIKDLVNMEPAAHQSDESGAAAEHHSQHSSSKYSRGGESNTSMKGGETNGMKNDNNYSHFKKR